MIKKAGVYTAKCPGCGRSILVHLASDGSVSPSECPGCHVGFAGIDNGEQRHTFVAVVKKAEVKKAEVKEAEEKPASSAEASAAKKGKKLTIKTQKDSFKMWKDR